LPACVVRMPSMLRFMDNLLTGFLKREETKKKQKKQTKNNSIQKAHAPPSSSTGSPRQYLRCTPEGIVAQCARNPTNTTVESRVPTLTMCYEERKVYSQSANTCSRRHFLRLAASGVGAVLVGRGGIARAASGKISVYSALNESTNNAFVEAFKKSVPGINVELLP